MSETEKRDFGPKPVQPSLPGEFDRKTSAREEASKPRGGGETPENVRVFPGIEEHKGWPGSEGQGRIEDDDPLAEAKRRAEQVRKASGGAVPMPTKNDF